MKKPDGKTKCPSCQKYVKHLNTKTCEWCNRYLSANEISVGDRVAYIPIRDTIVRGITDNAYDCFGFYPGDIMTVRDFGIDERGFKYVLVEGRDEEFSPYEFAPASGTNIKDVIQSTVKLYNELKKKYS